jgi:hypothetical protein
MIWSKGFVMERERFDGADVTHLLRAVGPKLNWDHVWRASSATGRFCSPS